MTFERHEEISDKYRGLSFGQQLSVHVLVDLSDDGTLGGDHRVSETTIRLFLSYMGGVSPNELRTWAVAEMATFESQRQKDEEAEEEYESGAVERSNRPDSFV